MYMYEGKEAAALNVVCESRPSQVTPSIGEPFIADKKMGAISNDSDI